MQVALALMAGLVAGLVHVWSGPDHLAAVAPLSVRRTRHWWAAGVRWGVGHSSGVLFIGLAALFFREALPLDSLSLLAERAVGLVLIAIGIWGIRTVFSERVHSHPHTHEGINHAHFHVHESETAHAPRETGRHVHTHAAIAIGTLHGIAGSSHFIGVLPALAFPDMWATITYLVAYGVGTVVGMAAFSTVIASLQGWRTFAGPIGYRRLMCGCSCGALGIGVYWIF